MIEGQKRTGWVLQNVSGTVRSKGFELFSQYKLSNSINFDLNYTYTSTYDGADFDDPDVGPQSNGAFTNSQLVRIPRHFINLTSRVSPTKDLNIALKTKWSDEMRDYENVNSTVGGDQRLKSFLVNDLTADYILPNGYKAFFKVDNIFDEVYSTALEYNQMDRSFNFGLKKTY